MLHGFAKILIADLLLNSHGQIDNGDVDGWYSECHTSEFSLKNDIEDAGTLI